MDFQSAHKRYLVKQMSKPRFDQREPLYLVSANSSQLFLVAEIKSTTLMFTDKHEFTVETYLYPSKERVTHRLIRTPDDFYSLLKTQYEINNLFPEYLI